MRTTALMAVMVLARPAAAQKIVSLRASFLPLGSAAGQASGLPSLVPSAPLLPYSAIPPSLSPAPAPVSAPALELAAPAQGPSLSVSEPAQNYHYGKPAGDSIKLAVEADYRASDDEEEALPAPAVARKASPAAKAFSTIRAILATLNPWR